MSERVLNRNTVLVLIASFFYLSSPMLVNPLIAGFTQSFGASGAIMGMVGGAMNLCALVCRPFAGNFADRFSKYHVSLIGAILMFVGCAGYAAAPNTFVVFMSRIVNGIGYSCCSVCMATWMSNLLPRNKIGSGMGFYGTINALAMAIAPAVGVQVMQTLGYREAFVLSAICCAGIMVVIQFISDRNYPKKSGEVAAKQKFRLVELSVVPIALTIMCFAIPYFATQAFIVTYILEKHSALAAGLFFPIYAAFLVVLRLSLKSLFDKLPFKVFLAAGSACALFSMVFLYRMDNIFDMILAALFMAGGYGVMCSVCQSNAILAAGEGHRGLANSTYYIGLDLGMAFGPLLGGIIYGALPIQNFYAVFMLMVPLCIAIYAVSNAVVKRLKKS